LAKLSQAIAATVSFALLHLCLGCGAGLVQVQDTPAINQVIPQTIAAGSKNLTIKVSGTNFTSDSVILWNGNAISTSLIDSNTLSSPLASSIVATPSTVQLQVQNTVTKASSTSVPVVITTPANGASVSPLSLLTTSLPQPTLGTAYSVALAASGGTPTYNWIVTGGQLPPGLSLSSTTGVISGAPTSNGSFSFTITVTDSGSPTQTATMQYGLTVPPPVSTPPPPTPPTPLQITPSLPAGVVGSMYSGSLQVTGGTAPYTWSSSALPAGLSLGSNGVISGDPTSGGSTSVTFTVSDSSTPAQTDSIALPLSIAPSSLTINSVNLPSGTDGSAYTAALSATGGTAPYAWSVSGLPAGLSLSGNGVIAGTPTATGNFSLAVTVTDSQNPAKAASAILPLSVSATIAPLTITSTAVAPGTSNQPYSAALSATGGIAPYTWSVSGLPAGLSLGGNGTISGIPTTTGNFSLAITVTDGQSPAKTASANIPLSVTAAIAPLVITSTTVASGTSNQPYSATLSATGGTAPYTWSVSGLPTGLSLGSNGVISGTPTATGNFSLAITATDSQSPAKTTSVSLPLSVTAAIAPLVITSTTVASGTSNQPYSTKLNTTGGIAPYIWSVSGLPAGLNLGSNGVISGTPTATGTFSLAITVTDSQSPAKTASASLPLSVTAAIAPLTITSTTVASSTSNQPYSATLSATGGTAPYTWSVTGLPTGLNLGSNGVISGTPTATGNFSLAVTVTDSQSPAKTASANIPLSVAAAIAPLTITSTAVASATSNQPYSTTLSATGGTAPYTWSVTGLPAGLSLGGNGVITGSPTVTGNFSLAVTVTDSQSPAKTASANIPLSVAAAIAPLTITSTTVANGTSNQSYSATLSATGGTAPYTWSVSGLPTGLSLGSNGVISGSPTATGNFSLAITVTDSQSPAKTASATIPLVVSVPALTITSSTLPSGTDGSAYSGTLQASGGTPAYTWSISTGSLPAGLTLAATTGVISGTPSVTGTSTFTATVSDNGNPVQTKSVSESITLSAAQPPPGPGTTWYIRPDGGTNIQCTGKTNAAYPGSGSAQACAFNHPYWMIASNGTAWAHFSGGDTIQFVNTSGSSDTYYMGEKNGGLGFDWNGNGLSSICPAPNSGGGDGASCILPAPPSGTATQHTRILGQNAGNCHDSNHTHLVNPTILSGINTVFAVLDTRATNYVDISCIEITQPDTCTNAVATGQCGTNANNVKYGGLILNYGPGSQGPSNLTLTDFAVVGTSGSGFLGSKLNKTSSDVFSATDVYLIGNGEAGWNGDSGGCDTSCESVGSMNLSHVMIDWNGCVAVKPYDMTKPDTQNAFNYCYDDSTEGYGDGFVQVAAGNLTMNVDHSFFRWNTQDGFDSLHLSDDVKTSPAIHISDSWSEGNEGQTFKLGAGSASSGINNVSISNCRVLATASNFPLNPTGWNTGVSDTCRAAGDQWAFQLNNGTAITLENNTSVGYGTTMYDVECAALAPNCAANGATFIFRNNISKGYPDPGDDNRLASGIYLGAGNVFANSGSAIDHNLWSTMNTGCPDGSVDGGYEKIYTCGDPDLVGESNINAINPNITSSSPAINSGIAISGITTDYNGNTRANPPAIGAIEP
jgi:hypothetical protein